MLLQDLPEVDEEEAHCGLIVVVVVDEVDKVVEHRRPVCGPV